MKENKLNTKNEKGKGTKEDNDDAYSITELVLIAFGAITLVAILLWDSTELGFMCSFFIWLALCSL